MWTARGNRIAAMTFGPGKVIIVCGVNKIVPDLSAARERVRQVAAPLNNLRLATGNPCIQAGTAWIVRQKGVPAE